MSFHSVRSSLLLSPIMLIPSDSSLDGSTRGVWYMEAIAGVDFCRAEN